MDGAEYIGAGVAIVGVLQGLNLWITSALKAEIKDVWARANKHGHVIECDSKGCKPKTIDVIIKEGGEG